jgi:tRNA(adenine34) deaminase
METDLHEKFMKEALAEARAAYDAGEVPIGCVIVKDGAVIARAHNMTEADHNALAHAEMLALQAAIADHGWRLPDCDMYVTLEPCSMCAGAIVHARIKNLFVAARDPKSGACGSVLDVVGEPSLNHHPALHFGLCEEESRGLLQQFFKELRNSQK